MKKYDDMVHPEKITLIQSMLSDPVINELWIKYISLLQVSNSSSSWFNERDKLWKEYCYFRDQFLGLPPLVVPHIQGTNRRNMF